MRKAYEAIRIEPISCWKSTAAGGGALGSTISGGVIDVSKGIGDFTVLVGAQANFGTANVFSTNSGTWVTNVHFALYEATAATHAGSAITGASLALGCATAGTLRGLYDAFITVTSALATTVNITINGLSYHNTALHAGAGSAAATELAYHINGGGTHVGHPKLPHYTADIGPTASGFITSGVIYLHPDDDQATGLTIVMDAVSDVVVPYWHHVMGKIDVNGHALSTVNPKYLSVRMATMAGCSAAQYAFLMRRGGQTPGALVALNT